MQVRHNIMKLAIVHDWLVSQRGGENVLDAICELFPSADLYTLLYVPGQVSGNITRLKRHVSILQKVPFIEKRYRYFLPVMPWVIERFDMSQYDLIISSSHCVAKGIRKKQGAHHISYIHAPMRYMWDRFDEYFSKNRAGLITRLAANIFRPYLQNWDKKSARNVDGFIANSHFIASKVEEYYGKKAPVVYPFCETDFFSVQCKPGNYYLMVTALVPYKRVDLAIEAFNQMGKPLFIIGDGPDRERLQKKAHPNIDFLGVLKKSSLADLYAKSKALIFPGVEDFGIVPLEAMSCGVPVIAFGKGGVLETITKETGIFFYEPTAEALIQAVEKFESKTFSVEACKAQATIFTREKFQKEFLETLKTFLPTKIWSFLKNNDSAPQYLEV